MSLLFVASFLFSHEKNSLRKNDEISIYFTDSQLFFDPSSVNKLLTLNTNEQSNELKESLDLYARGLIKPLVSHKTDFNGAEELHNKIETGDITGRAGILI